MASFELGLRFEPDDTKLGWSRSMARLMQDFERGWPEYEWRWKRTGCQPRPFAAPLWDGTSLEGKTILLWCEQGLGDMIQFVRYAGEIKKRGATVWLECPAKMVALFSTCRGIDRMFAEGTALPAFDCQAPLMSLPAMCKTTLSTVPAEVPYLFGDPVLVERWRHELDDGLHFKVGIAWQGSPDYRWDRHRSFDLCWFESLANIEGVKLYSLQKGMGTEQLASLSFPVVDLGKLLDEHGNAFQDTAAVMLALDLIITCDSALAHLAGALGVHVWVPLAMLSDWRSLLERQDSIWYPTMRLFRQRNLSDWYSVYERIGRELIAWRGYLD